MSVKLKNVQLNSSNRSNVKRKDKEIDLKKHGLMKKGRSLLRSMRKYLHTLFIIFKSESPPKLQDSFSHHIFSKPSTKQVKD